MNNEILQVSLMTIDDQVMQTNSFQARGAVTQQQIADRVGLSRATVSYVLNDQTKKFGISPQTAENIRQTAAEMGYVPNAMARSLKNQRTATIGVLVADFQLDWTHRIQVGMEKVLGDTEFTPIYAPRGWDAQRERKEIDWFLERRVDGLIICVPIMENLDYYQSLRQMGLPVLFFGDLLKGMEDAHYVLWDAAEAVKAGMAHLYEAGKRRIGFFGYGQKALATLARSDAYWQSLEDLGLPYDPSIHYLSDPPVLGNVGWQQRFFRFFQGHGNPLDGLMALNDAVTIGLMNFAEKEMQKSIPEDIALVGMGNLPVIGPGNKRLTTLEEPLQQMGELAARGILTLIENPDSGPFQKWVRHNRLIIRDTTVSGEREMLLKG